MPGRFNRLDIFEKKNEICGSPPNAKQYPLFLVHRASANEIQMNEFENRKAQ